MTQKTTEEQKQKVIIKRSGPNFESVHDAWDRPTFLVYDAGKFALHSPINVRGDDNSVYQPIEQQPYEKYIFGDSELKENAWKTPRLFKVIRAVFERYVVVEDIWLDFFAAIVLLYEIDYDTNDRGGRF
jgi:hypothetical protein